MRRSWARWLVSLWTLASLAHGNLPYNPARAFRSTDEANSLAYVFLQSSSTFQLLALNFSTTIDASNVPYSTLSSSLPFLQDGAEVAFTPVWNENGNISVYSGGCTPENNKTRLWQIELGDNRDTESNWIEKSVGSVGTATGNTWLGANFLTSGISFSSEVDDSYQPMMYVFGGMCPISSASAETWTSSANYSNTMLALTPAGLLEPSPSGSSSASGLDYAVLTTRNRGSPIAEAGYSISALQPSYSNGSGTMSIRQQNFVLLGGHTQHAFVNMSQAALFSLPEESWTFLPIDPPLGSRSNTDLTVRQDPASIDSRSGHTATITSDGKRVVVLGGWVGDVSTPANPQLLILELGKGYGGTGSWKWSLPAPTGDGISGSQGIYGHASMMLPGDVLMVVGGYSISDRHGLLVKRSEQLLSKNTYFLNLTANTWIPSYTHPATQSQGQSGRQAQKASGFSSSSKKVALGSGLAFGIIAIIGIVFVWWCYSRRLRKRRNAREKQIRHLGLATQAFDPVGSDLETSEREMAEKSAFRFVAPRSYMQQNQAYPWVTDERGGSGEDVSQRENRATKAERTGLLVEIPSPTRGLRRSLQSRSRTGERISYQLAPTRDDGRRSFAGDIHPIDERDEFEDPADGGITVAESDMLENNLVSLAPTLDPFRDPDPLGSHPLYSDTSPISPAHGRELEIQEWISDWAAAEAHLHGNSGRLSPNRSSPDKDRTSSNLSDYTVSSAVSHPSQQQSAGSLTRSISQRSTSFFLGSSMRSSGISPTLDQTSGRTSPQHRRSQSLRLHGRPSSSGHVVEQRTATDFTQLQAEGEALLPRPELGSHPESPTRSRPRRSSWLGSMRRAFPFGGNADRNLTLGNEDRSVSSSPTKSIGGREDDHPRRAASAGAAYWRRKQGAADWGAESNAESSQQHSQTGQDEEEWDVEAAVERRVVQVMFTVPKEKLRVVNAGEDTDLLSEIDGEEKEPSQERASTTEGKGKGKATEDSPEEGRRWTK